MKKVANLIEWNYLCSDNIQEKLEDSEKVIMLIAGASSSGKGYASEKLVEHLQKQGLSTILLSTDDYYKGISSMMVDKVNKNSFGNNLNNIDSITNIVRETTINTPFGDKFSNENIKLISDKLELFLPKNVITKVCVGLKEEFAKINFDEPEAINLNQFINDLKTLETTNYPVFKRAYSMKTGEFENTESFNSEGKNVIVIEGLYALHPSVLKALNKNNLVTSFIESDPKSLFERRVIRDAKRTSCSNATTVKLLLKVVMPSYKQHILPTKDSADFIFNNEISYEELKSGKVERQNKLLITNYEKISSLLNEYKVGNPLKIKDLYLVNADDKQNNPDNILRLRSIKKDGKYELDSLTHKGISQVRNDSKLVRPINEFIKTGEFEEIYQNEDELLKDLLINNFRIKKEIFNTRINYNINGLNCALDNVQELGTFFEIREDNYNNKIKHQMFFNKLGIEGKSCPSLFSQSIEKQVCEPKENELKFQNQVLKSLK